jgi:NitT/TauT family transport system permease protein
MSTVDHAAVPVEEADDVVAAGPATPVVRPSPSSARAAYLKRRRRTGALVGAVQLSILVVAVGTWQVAATRGWVDPLLTSRPTAVWDTLGRLAASGELWTHVRITLTETVIGFSVGMAIGLVVAVALWWWAVVGRVFEPYLVTANALPKIALGPILYVWLGATMSVYGMAIAISVIVTILMIYEGFRSVDAEKVKLLRTFGATRAQVLRMVVLPANVPTLVNTAKVTIGLTLVGVIVGEFISSNAGLGYLIIYGSQVFQMDLVMASIVVLLVISVAMYLVITAIERRLLRQR